MSELLVWSSQSVQLSVKCVCRTMWNVKCVCTVCCTGDRAMCVLLCIYMSTIYRWYTGCSDSEIHFLLHWNVEMVTATCTFTTKFSCISQLIHLCRSTAFWIWEFSMNTITIVTLPMFIKLSWKFACFCLSLLSCSSSLRNCPLMTACRHKLIFEWMFHLLSNTVIYKVTPQNHFNVCIRAQ